MSIIERIDMFTMSLPHNCLYCKFGDVVFSGYDDLIGDHLACMFHATDGLKSKKFAAEELRERRYRQYWESLARSGLATVCPGCGRYTKCKSGFCRQCSKKVMNYAN